MKKSFLIILVIGLLLVLVSGCRFFQSKEDKAREEYKKRIQSENWDTSDIPDFDESHGVGLPEVKK